MMNTKISSIRSRFLENENKQLSDIRSLVSAKLQAFAVAEIKEEPPNMSTEKEIRAILENIDTVISEQSRVLDQKFTLSELYADLLDDSFSYLQAGQL